MQYVPNDAEIQAVLFAVSMLALGGLAVFQYLHYIIAAWRYWRNSPDRVFWTTSVALSWAIFGAVALGFRLTEPSYVAGLPITLTALYAPSVVAIMALLISPKFRAFADSLSLRWMIFGFAGPARMIVGVIFLLWYFAGRLPAIVAWIAGPGDWISGFITIWAISYLGRLAEHASIGEKDWSARDLQERMPKVSDPILERRLRRSVWIALACVIFGIADFLAAPASTAISIAWGEVPEEMGRLPLALIPHLLVPQVLVLEVLALRQLIKLLFNMNKLTFAKSDPLVRADIKYISN